MPKTLSLVVPAFNEEARFEPFLKQLIEFKKKNSFLKEIVVVNDGSTDGTLGLLNRYKQDLKIVSYKKNMGKGFAVKQGMLAASSDLIAFMDADGATPASQITAMYNALLGNDFVIGNRKNKKARVVAKQPWYRLFLSWGFNTTVDLLFGLYVGDVLCGFKGMEKNLAKEIANEMVSNRWIFDVEMIARVKQKGKKTAIIPIEWSHVKGSRMGIGLNNVKMLLELFKLKLRLGKEKINAKQ